MRAAFRSASAARDRVDGRHAPDPRRRSSPGGTPPRGDPGPGSLGPRFGLFSSRRHDPDPEGGPVRDAGGPGTVWHAHRPIDPHAATGPRRTRGAVGWVGSGGTLGGDPPVYGRHGCAGRGGTRPLVARGARFGRPGGSRPGRRKGPADRDPAGEPSGSDDRTQLEPTGPTRVGGRGLRTSTSRGRPGDARA